MEQPKRESLTVEFKSDRKCLPMSDLYEALVGMANTDGGFLYLGIEDNGDVTGVHPQHTNLGQMQACIQDNTVPPLYIHLYTENWDDKNVLVINIPISRQLMMTADGKYLRRRIKKDGTPETVSLKPYEILQRLSYIQALDPSAQVIDDLSADQALSPLERERLRNMVRTYHGGIALCLSYPMKNLIKRLVLLQYATMEHILLLPVYL